MPTEAEIEAAAKALCLARKPSHESIDDDRWWETHGMQGTYRVLARAALEAAETVRAKQNEQDCEEGIVAMVKRIEARRRIRIVTSGDFPPTKQDSQ